MLPREAWAKRVIGRDEGLAFHVKEHNAYFDSDGSKDGELAATTLQLIHDAMVQDDPLHAAQSAHDLRGRRLLLFQSVEPRPGTLPSHNHRRALDWQRDKKIVGHDCRALQRGTCHGI